MFCLRLASLCLLLAVAIDLSSGVHLNADNFIELPGYPDINENEDRFLVFENDFIETIAEDTFKKRDNVRLFSVHKNPVSVIPKNLFQYNKKLCVIFISNCQIASLHPDTFAAQTGLAQLYLDQNYLTEIDEGLFRHNTNLTSLDLSHNRLTEIKPNRLKTLVKLKYIALDGNRLTSLSENLFAHNPKLIYILLNSNHIKVLPINLFKNNVNLMNLYLQNNRLSSFDMNSLLTSSQMIELGLYNNDLTEIVSYDKLFQYWPQLNNISLTGNNFNCSYFQTIYDYCTEKSINLYVSKEESVKHPEDQLINGNSCIEDKDFATVSVARISAPDAPYEDVQKTYTGPVKTRTEADVATSIFYPGFAYIAKLLFIEGYIGEQEVCDEGRDLNFMFI